MILIYKNNLFIKHFQVAINSHIGRVIYTQVVMYDLFYPELLGVMDGK